ncbi:MAG TPA: ABC transporter permease [Opitutaceae bacterium]|nr:ABC transporter permease [Opitutaceae bacterium]
MESGSARPTTTRLLPGAAEFFGRLAQSDYLVLGLCVVYLASFAPFTPGLLSLENLGNLLQSLLPLSIAALGLTVVLIIGGIDLSITAVIGLTSVIGAKMMSSSHGWLADSAFAVPAALLAMLACGAAVGALNGIGVTVLKLPPFILTLTTMMAVSGFAVWLTKSRNIGGLPEGFSSLWASLWFATLLTAVIAALLHLLLARSVFGRWCQAIGFNSRAARVSGVPIQGMTFAVYVICGVCAAVAGILFTAQAETGSPVLGQRVLLDVLGATVLGGTSLFGGRGKIHWTLCGVLFLRLVDNSLNLLSLSIFTITMVKGGVILAAALLDAARSRLTISRK